MKYILFVKNNIATAKCCYKLLKNIKSDLYDSYEEITEKEYNSIVLPSEKINGEWVKTDIFPKIEYPNVSVTTEPTTEDILNTLLGEE